MEEKKPSEWAMRAAKAALTADTDESYRFARTWIKGSEEDAVPLLARIIDDEHLKWIKQQDPQNWRNAGPFPLGWILD